MKKLLALSVTALALPLVAHAEPIDQQKVYISGEVVAQTCSFDAKSNIVQLEKIKIADLKNGQDNLKEFAIKLKDCDIKSTQTVAVAFDAKGDNVADNGHLNNVITSASASKGVQIKITDLNGNTLNLKNGATSERTPQRVLKNGQAEFKFKAGYALEGGVEPITGLVSSSIPVTIAYQ